MLFMLVSRTKPGTKRQQIVDRLTEKLHQEMWDLVRHGGRALNLRTPSDLAGRCAFGGRADFRPVSANDLGHAGKSDLLVTKLV
jgi:hypothetical protein